MGTRSRAWIREHQKELETTYLGKVVIVCEDHVAQVLDPDASVLEINDTAERLCGDKDWSYTFVCGEEAYVL
jgi:hypothetical protein